MAFNKLDKPRLWSLAVKVKQNLSDKDRDFIAELVSEEARKASEPYRFILHDVIESKKYCQMLIEGTKTAVGGLLLTIQDNFFGQISYGKYVK